MSWNPREKTIDTRFLGRNILKFIADNNADALLWANDGNHLKPFKEFSLSIANRTKPVFPSLAIVSDSNATDWTGGDHLVQSAYEITLEAMIYGQDAAEISLTAKKYAFALENLLCNISKTDLQEGISQIQQSVLNGLQTEYEELKTNDTQNAFMQMFQTKATYFLITSVY